MLWVLIVTGKFEVLKEKRGSEDLYMRKVSEMLYGGGRAFLYE